MSERIIIELEDHEAEALRELAESQQNNAEAAAGNIIRGELARAGLVIAESKNSDLGKKIKTYQIFEE